MTHWFERVHVRPLRSIALKKAAEALSERETQRFALLPANKKQIVAYHDSWRYLTDWLGLRAIGFLEPKPGIAPTPTHIAKLLGDMRRVLL